VRWVAGMTSRDSAQGREPTPRLNAWPAKEYSEVEADKGDIAGLVMSSTGNVKVFDR